MVRAHPHQLAGLQYPTQRRLPIGRVHCALLARPDFGPPLPPPSIHSARNGANSHTYKLTHRRSPAGPISNAAARIHSFSLNSAPPLPLLATSELALGLAWLWRRAHLLVSSHWAIQQSAFGTERPQQAAPTLDDQSPGRISQGSNVAAPGTQQHNWAQDCTAHKLHSLP